MDWVKHEDYAIFRLVNVKLHSPILDPVSTVLSYSGLGVSVALFALFLAIFPSTRRLTIPVWLTQLLAGAIIADAFLKPDLSRDRPSHLSYAIREEPHLAASFPSGHSCVSFGTAFVILFIAWNTPQRKWGWMALVWAALVGLSRIYRGVHWPTDVLAGAFVGLFSASVVTLATQRLWDKPGKKKGKSKKGKRRKPTSRTSP